MKNPNTTIKQLIILEWIDASLSAGEDTFTQEEAEEEKLIHGFVYGVLVAEFDDRYVVARDWFDDHNTYRGVASYPKSGVVKAIKKPLAESNK